MKAAFLENGNVTIKDVPIPEPKHEEALIRLTTTGVCHSDVHLAKGDWPHMIPPYPLPIGHEGIGIVEKLGPGAEKFVSEGDRVILGLGGTGGGYWCGACEFCLGGKPRLCRQAKGIIGAYAEYISLWAKSLVKLPGKISDQEVPLACAGLTAYGAVKKLVQFNILPGKPIAIIGAAGGLGHYAVQIAKAFGYTVVGVDIGQEKQDFILELGADYAVAPDEARKFTKERFKGVYASIVFTPKLAGFELGFKILKRGGIFISVGMPPATEPGMTIHPLEILRKDILILSSAVGTVDDMRNLVGLAAAGKVRTHISRTANLSEINDIFEALHQGKYSGRAIINNFKE